MSMERLTKVFRSVFERDDLVLRSDLAAVDVDNWDSFNHINLILALEEEYEISFTTEQITGLQNVGDLVGLLNEHGHNLSFDD